MAEEEIEYISYKKVIIFGAEGSGKSTLSKYLDTEKFSEETHTENGK
jgi:adenylate kinase family enzyme